MAGLQEAYSNRDDQTLKNYTYMFLSLAMVPVDRVPATYRILCTACPDEFLSVYDFFDKNYIHCIPARCQR